MQLAYFFFFKYIQNTETLYPKTIINSGIEKISSLKSLRIEDFLGRDEVSTDWSLLDRDFKNKNIIVFGAAGSIGFEIGKQLFKYKPKNLIFGCTGTIGEIFPVEKITSKIIYGV